MAPANPHERVALKIVFWVVGILIFIIAFFSIVPGLYSQWQLRRLIEQGNAQLAAGDFKAASLTGRRAIQLNDTNVEACRLLAELTERTGVSTAVEWRQRVLYLNGAAPADLVALARTALRFGEIQKAADALGKIPEGETQNAEYHLTAANLAAAKNNPAKRAEHLREAVRLAPSNPSYRLQLAATQLESADFSAQDQGRATLLQLQNDPAVAKDATMRLLLDASKRFDSARAVALAQQIIASDDATFTDQIAALNALSRARDPGYDALLERLKTEAQSAPEKAGALLSWMNLNQLSFEAAKWGQTLPPEVLGQRPVAIAFSEAYVNTRDWDSLLKFLKNVDWKSLDFLRLALMARALREKGDDSAFRVQWNAAIQATKGNPDTLVPLAEDVLRWGWEAEAIDLLWLVAKDRAKGKPALISLYDYYAQARDTQNLYRVLLRLDELQPDDRKIQNNLAQISLLLHLNVERAQKLALSLHQAEPKNPVYASTYAFSLHDRGDNAKALKVFQTLPEEDLRQPAVAAYYGIILAALGDRPRASEFLALANTAALLPEEKALVEKAQRAVSGG